MLESQPLSLYIHIYCTPTVRLTLQAGGAQTEVLTAFIYKYVLGPLSVYHPV